VRAALAGGPGIVTHASARSLARMGDGPALEWLLAHPQRLGPRRPAEWSGLLRRFGRPALPRLLAELERGTADGVVLRAVIEALGHARFLAATPAIERALPHPDLDVRVAAARALGRLRARPCSAALLDALRDTE